MSRAWRCDECGTEVLAPYMLCYPTEPDDDDDDVLDEGDSVDFCGPECLATWATRLAVEQAVDTL